MLKFSPPKGGEILLCPRCGNRAFRDPGCTVSIECIRTIPGFSAQSPDGEPVGLVIHCSCGAEGVAPLMPRSK